MQIGGIVALVSFGVGFGVNYGRISALEQMMETRIQAERSLVASTQQLAVSVGIIQTQVQELGAKIGQLQVVVIETRNAVIGVKRDE